MFSLFYRKYHCRNCGNVVCNNCSDNRHSLKKFGYDKCCNTCDKFIKMQYMNSNDLSRLSLKELKEYIQAYSLPSKTAIEKDDLVRIIFNTRPLSNENELHYRNLRQASSAANPSSSNAFSFSNMVQEIFSPGSSPPRPRQESPRQESPRPESQSTYNPTAQTGQPRPPPVRQQPTRQQPTRQSSSSPHRQSQPRQQPKQTQSKPDVITLNDLVQSKTNISSLSVRTLKSILKANYVEHSHVIEKSELIKLVNRLTDQQRKSQPNDDVLCRICLDAEQNCVFLNCGHMAACMDCAKTLTESKNECPICREPIIKLVHVFRS